MHKINGSKFGHGTFEDRPLDDAELMRLRAGWLAKKSHSNTRHRTSAKHPRPKIQPPPGDRTHHSLEIMLAARALLEKLSRPEKEHSAADRCCQ